MAGVRLAWQIAHQPEIARHVDHVAVLTEETISSDDALAAYVRATVATQFHPCGTARMGPPGDAMAVVDQHCRLRAVDNLRVVDASVMPTIPRANINLTCIMIGEHAVRLDAGRVTSEDWDLGSLDGQVVVRTAGRQPACGIRYDAGSEGPESSERPSGLRSVADPTSPAINSDPRASHIRGGSSRADG